MRAPSSIAPSAPVEAYKARFWGPGVSPLGNTIARALSVSGDTLSEMAATHAAIGALSDDTAGRARALRDKAALASLVDAHAGLTGDDAVVAQPLALDELAKVQANGQATLGSPGMVAAYDQQMVPAIGDATGQVTAHALRQAVVERQVVAESELRAAQQAAADAWQNPARLVDGLDTVKAIAADQARSAASPEEQATAIKSAVGGAVAGAVGQAFAAGEPEFAAHLLGGWGDTLAPAAYQIAVAKLDQANQTQRIAKVFGDAAGGVAQGDMVGAADGPARSAVAIEAPAGAAVHPIAGGTVNAVGGEPGNARVSIVHPDGSTTAYGGLGMAAVAPGDLVTPAHVIGSASPMVTMAANTPAGDDIDAGLLLRNGGGAAAVIGRADTPRNWDIPAMLVRIAQHGDLMPEERALAAGLAERRMTADNVQQAANDVSAGRSVVSLHAAAPDTVRQATDLPPDVAGQLSPATLAQVDGALRRVAQAVTMPAPDNAAALRLELELRQTPAAFVQRNLAPLIGDIHPADLAQLASSQAGMAQGVPDDGARSGRAAILDAIARHEVVNATQLPDDLLPEIQNTSATMMRLDQIDPSDRASINNTVANAIQSRIGQL
ncbi:M23 family metallopeptidase [Novosphingobium sp.]|uniref:M23 family metallopeptidase n=1 Tax=Novosphingobium sp. TaxID=1874826 RepID=UPI003D0D0F8D